MKIAVIGCGNMSVPIVSSIAKVYPEIEFHTFTPSKTRAIELANKVGGTFHKELATIVDMDYWLIACKPQQLNDLSLKLGEGFKNQKIISILAGTSIESLSNKLNTNMIFRVMPNTPCSLGLGISLIMTAKNVKSEDKIKLADLFKTCGEIINVESEKEFDELTIFSGSGPAYVFRFAKSYFLKLKQLGFSDELSRKLLDQLFLGSAHLMKNSNEDLETMIDKVTSKGGVTIEAIDVLEKNALDKIIDKSIDAGIIRAKQISRE